MPPLTSVGEAGELIEGLERADALHVLGVEPFSDFRSRAQFDPTEMCIRDRSMMQPLLPQLVAAEVAAAT